MAYYTVDRELVDPDFHDGVVKSFMDELPLQTAIGRIKGEPVDITQDIEIEALPQVYDAAVAEGVDYDPNQAQKIINPKMTVVMEQFRSKGWKVTRLRQKIKGHNETKGGTAAKKRAVDARNLALSIEHALGSEQEAVTYATSNGKPVTRGAMCWLKKFTKPTVAAAGMTLDETIAAAVAALHPVYPIPMDVLPVAGYEADVASLTEELFKAELIKAKLQVGGSKLKLLGLVGTQLKVLMSEWLGKSTAVQGMNSLIQANRNVNDKRIQLICDEFAYDGVDLKVICADTLLADTTTYALQDASYKSGIFIRPELWGVQTLEAITHYDTIDNGGGPGGYHDATLRLTCLNPMGQFRVKHIAA